MRISLVATKEHKEDNVFRALCVPLWLIPICVRRRRFSIGRGVGCFFNKGKELFEVGKDVPFTRDGILYGAAPDRFSGRIRRPEANHIN